MADLKALLALLDLKGLKGLKAGTAGKATGNARGTEEGTLEPEQAEMEANRVELGATSFCFFFF